MNSLWLVIVKRLGLGIVTLIAVSIIIFVAIEMLPGDIAQIILGQSATPETVAVFRQAR